MENKINKADDTPNSDNKIFVECILLFLIILGGFILLELIPNPEENREKEIKRCLEEFLNSNLNYSCYYDKEAKSCYHKETNCLEYCDHSFNTKTEKGSCWDSCGSDFRRCNNHIPSKISQTPSVYRFLFAKKEGCLIENKIKPEEVE